MKQRARRIETREPSWWQRLNKYANRNGLDEAQRDELFEIVVNAVHEDKAAELGSLGGMKGGKARAASMTARQRTESASKAARARWHTKSCRFTTTVGLLPVCGTSGVLPDKEASAPSASAGAASKE